MDESFHEFESELRSLRLRSPSPRVLARVQLELAPEEAPVDSARKRYQTATTLSSWKWSGWLRAGVAAALLVIAAVTWPRLRSPEKPDALPPAGRWAAGELPASATPADPSRGNLYRPVAASNVLYDLKDEGPVNEGGDLPARRVRYRYLDTYTWKNPQGNSSLKWSVPRDEIRVIPASLN